MWWRRKDTGEEWNNVTTEGTKHVVHPTNTYVPYEVKIRARNEFGPGPESNLVIGYSGEDSESSQALKRSCGGLKGTRREKNNYIKENIFKGIQLK